VKAIEQNGYHCGPRTTAGGSEAEDRARRLDGFGKLMHRTGRRLGPVFVLLLAFSSLSLPAFAQAPAKGKDAKPVATKATDRIDINLASADKLKALPGIGDAFAKKIVDGRPSSGKDDLISKNTLSEATYNKIKDMIVARQTVKAKK
jgi:competence protein ComEA